MDTETSDGPHGDDETSAAHAETSAAHADAAPTAGAPLDLDAIERDLADVEVALSRLDAGTYWTDEVTGSAIPDETLAADPITRRA